ncbi:hypothetical protein [Peribacillus frigoritolerans]|uniref:hypothetical protein n=1 Tax=Peribacillus castrilensis TaxID=2897690 RepID=UPI002DCA1D40|nr:hypothetical protein [Peribacillus castrilensis]
MLSDTLSKIYKNYALRTPKFEQILIVEDAFKKLRSLHINFRQALGQDIQHASNSIIDYELSRISFKLATELSCYKEIVTEFNLAKLTERLKSLNANKPEISEIVNGLTGILELFATLDTNSLRDCLENLIKYSSYKYSIITYKPVSESLKDEILRKYPSYTIRFLTFKGFQAQHKLYDQVFFIGNLNLYSGNLLNAINATQFTFITHAAYKTRFNRPNWIENKARIISSLPTLDYKEQSSIYNYLPDEGPAGTAIFEEVIEEPVISEQIVVHLTAEAKKDAEDTSYVDCKLVELENEEIIFLESSPRSRIDTVSSDYIFKRVNIQELKAHDYIVLSNFNSWDERKTYVDELYKDTKILLHRKRQANLQKSLSRNVEKYGLKMYTDLVNEKYGISVKRYQIKNLLKKESFKMQDNQVYYQFLLGLCKNNEEKANQYYQSSIKLDSYHRDSGKHARRVMREYFNNIENMKSSLNENPTAKFKITPLEIEMKRIKSVSKNDYSLPGSKIGIPLNIQI